ncbi:hypothetical protein OG339_09310 [Streptosporangium sp. NBC_01495]|uniref:hypothetical protein n=1 Tax=Streptosporangium sp. NBC_01495 TaxID=2903899 RepID=UPI002E316FD4|nr:hypothetical protein [Streptosporangium sp. NBC_01495]
MFSIGEFSQLGQMWVRILRHYDTIGLLRPAHVDPDKGGCDSWVTEPQMTVTRTATRAATRTRSPR